ncbi:MAG: hypothetical protein ACYCQI_15990, partial [Gammaproteobacteria bacterium]
AEDFKDNPEDLVDLLSSSDEESIELVLNDFNSADLIHLLRKMTDAKLSFPFNKITTINLDGSAIASEELQTILKDFDNLKKINLNKCVNISKAFENLQPGQLRNLTEIKLDETDLTPEAFAKLLKSAPFLKTISLSNSKTPISLLLEVLKSQKLEHLESITLEGKNNVITSNALSILLNAAPALRNMHLYQTTFIDDLNGLRVDHPTKLEVINIDEASITKHGMLKLYQVAPMITSFSKEMFEMLTSNPQLRGLRFPNIGTCNINVERKGEDISSYLDHIPNIRSLFLHESTQTPITEFKTILNNLVFLHIETSQYGAKNLEVLLNAAPKLKDLCIQAPTPYLFANLQAKHLQKITNINIMPSFKLFSKKYDLHKNDYLTLFRYAPLEGASLQITNALAEAFLELTQDQLKNLKSLRFNNNNQIPLRAIEKLLLAAPNLESLDISENMKEELEKLEIFKKRNIKISYSEDFTKRFGAGRSGFGLGGDKKEEEEKDKEEKDKEELVRDSFFDTKHNPDQTSSYQEYFPGIPPTNYRTSVWEPDLDTLIGPSKNFKPADFTNTDIPNTLPEAKAYFCPKGIKTAKITKINDIVVLPSLDPTEKVFDLKVIDSEGRLFDPSKYESLYSSSTQFHGIKLPPGEYTIHYQVMIPPKPDLPANIQSQLRPFKKYGISNKTLEAKFSSFREFAKYQSEQKPPKGSCRHRSVCAYASLVETLGKENVRVSVVEKLHMYIEVRHDNVWHKVDLGGYPQNLEVEPMQNAKAIPMSLYDEKLEPIIIPPIPFEMKEDKLKSVVQKKFKLPACILADTDLALQDFYKQLHEHYPSDQIYVAHDPEDINLSSPGLTQEGKIEQGYTTLSQWLNKLKTKSGVICVDARQFDAKELAQLNDLLDGRIENKSLPPNVRIIIIDNPQRGYYGPDFRRRVPYKVTCPTPKEENLLQEQPKSLKDVIEIDLFQSPYWQNLVFGKWDIKEEEKHKDTFSFNWKKSSFLEFLMRTKLTEEKSRFPLFGAKHAGKSIVFKNPPLHDPRFCAFITELRSFNTISWADQVTSVSPDIRLYQSSGYNWSEFKAFASLSQLTGKEETQPYVLSDANIINFISDPIYQFSKENNRLIATNGYLTQQKNKSIDIVCSLGLSKGALAQLLTEAKKHNVRVRFLTPDLKNYPLESPLTELFKPETELKDEKKPQLPSELIISRDIDFTVQNIITKKKMTSIDLTCLDRSELIRRPNIDERVKKQLLETGKLSMHSELSSIARKLINGETVLLYGTVPHDLNDVITELALGYIEGEKYKGKLILVTSPKSDMLVDSIRGDTVEQPEVNLTEKIQLLEQIHKDASDYRSELSKLNPATSFAELEKKYYKLRLEKERQPLKVADEETISDKELSNRFDARRLRDTQLALTMSPWVMIEGATGIGKTHFLQNILKDAEKTTSDFVSWLEAKTEKGKNLIFIVDEASFMSQLSGEDENFLERFKSLKNIPPGMMYKGKYYELTPEHKVVFAFNPASYGAGRSTAGFLNDHNVPVSFERLPYFYIRARLINPVLESTIPKDAVENSNWIADPIYEVFKWINDPDKKCDGLFSGREIKMIMNIIASQIKANGIKGKDVIQLANDAAYMIGKQVLSDHPDLLQKFTEDHKSLRTNVLTAKEVKGYRSEQKEAYSCIQNVLTARQFLIDRLKESKQTSSVDLGLGGIVLEGDAGIGKTHFVEQLIKELEAKGETVCRISPSTPYFEKVALLRDAIKKGAIVVGEELNASLWPNKLLNNALMGLNEDGSIPTDKNIKPIVFITTQNPFYFAGRSEEDPALRRRMIKLKVDWPVYQSPVLELKSTT